MASLKETKNHIASVKSTLKITSAMKMVASAKLHKAQQAIEAMRPYEAALHDILMQAGGSLEGYMRPASQGSQGAVAVVLLSSSSSLCGGFNANVIREARARIAALRAEGRQVGVYSVGRKAADAMRRDGYASPADYGHLVTAPSYDEVADLAQVLVSAYESGEYERVELIYNHFVSAASQKVTVETYLPFSMADTLEDSSTAADFPKDADSPADAEEYIMEPDRASLLGDLIPKVIRLKLYTVVLDSVAAEHAARTVAMQTATDNGEEMLGDLTLQYNKDRQQKITFEILDLAAGAQR